MYKHQGGVQRRDGVALPGGADPAAQVRGGRTAAGQPARAERQDAAQGRPHRQARRRLREPRAHRADEAVRPRGLVRRAGRRPGLQRLRQVALPAAAGRRWLAIPTSSTGRSGEVPIKPVAHTGRASLGARVRPGWFVADARAPGADRPHAAGDPAPGRRAPRRYAAGAGRPCARPVRAGARVASRSSSRCPAASRRACRSCCSSCRERRCCCSTSRPTTSTSSPPRRWRRGSKASRAPSSRSPTTAGSPAASTASWSSAPTARSTSPTEPVWDEGRVQRAR